MHQDPHYQSLVWKLLAFLSILDYGYILAAASIITCLYLQRPMLQRVGALDPVSFLLQASVEYRVSYSLIKVRDSVSTLEAAREKRCSERNGK